MKKILRALFIVILVIVAIVVLVPVLFKNQILEKAREVANTSVNATVGFDDLRLSLIRNFPNLSVSLSGVSVVNKEPFEGDTLVSFDEFRATVDLLSVIGSEQIRVRGILLDHPLINVRILEDGTANYDIAPEGAQAETQEEDSAAGGGGFSIALKKFEIRGAALSYEDESTDMSASLEDFDFVLRGDLSADRTDISTRASAARTTFIMEGIPYVRNAVLAISLDVDADLANSVFTLGENSVGLNDLALMFGGTVKMPDEERIDVDMDFSTSKTEFKSLLSMVPAVYRSDFEGLRTGGSLGVSGAVKGSLTEDQSPSADIMVSVKDAMFSYPDLPKSADNINIDIHAHYDGVDQDKSVLDVNRFHIELGGNPVDLGLHVTTPMSDPQVSARLNAMVDFKSLAEVVPLDSTDISGSLKADVTMSGRMSSIEEEHYDQFQAGGTIELMNFGFSSPEVPVPVNISRTSMDFSPQYLALNEFDMKAGSSDLSMTGRLEHFIPYLFSDGTVRGKLELSSHLLDINDFMSESTVDTIVEPVDTTAVSVVEVPANVAFIVNADIGKIHYDNLDITDMEGIIEVADRKVMLRKLGMNLLDGSMIMNGEYDTRDRSMPTVDFHFDMQDIDIPKAFDAFNTVRILVPAARNASGNVSMQLDMTSVLAADMTPEMNTLAGAGRLQSKNVELDNSKVFNKIGNILKTDRYRTLSVNDLDVDFEIRNGRVYVDPFDVKLGRNTMTVSGDQGIDKTMNFNIAMGIPRSSLGSGAGSALEGLSSLAGPQGMNLAAGNTVNMNFLVSGMVDDPKVSPVFGSAGTGVKQQAREAVKERVQEQVKEVKQEVRENVEEKKASIMKEAGEEAQKIRDAAKKTGDELVRQAGIEGDQRIRDAGNNPIKKRAAEEYKKLLIKQAKDKSKKLQDEADARAEKVLQTAREKADKL